MNKTELIEAIAEKTGKTKKDVKEISESLFECITNEMAKGNKVQLIGFGTFDTTDRKEREAKNPKTGEKIIVKACKVPRVKFGKNVKDRVNE